jgi:hypothetical protein
MFTFLYTLKEHKVIDTHTQCQDNFEKQQNIQHLQVSTRL